MDDHYMVCGNCGHCTMMGGQYVCIAPIKPKQEVVPMGARYPCFVVLALAPRQSHAAVLSPAVSAGIN